MTLKKIIETLVETPKENFSIANDGSLKFIGRLCVPNNEGIKQEILHEAHYTLYSIHPGTTKMY